MTKKSKRPVLGFDPLAWMKDSREPPVGGRQSSEGDAGREHEAKATGSATKTDELRPTGDDSTLERRPTTADAFHLGETLTIETVRARHAELLALLGRRHVAIDAGALTAIDTAGLQLLAAFAAEARRGGIELVWQGVAPALRDGARRLDLERVLDLPPA